MRILRILGGQIKAGVLRMAAWSAPLPFVDLEISLSQRMAAKPAAIAETGVVARGQLWAAPADQGCPDIGDAALYPMIVASRLSPAQILQRE